MNGISMGDTQAGRRVLARTPVGPLTLVASPRGLREIRFGLPAGPETGVASVPAPEVALHLDAAESALERMLGGGEPGPLPALDLEGGTPFQVAVWRALLRIPRGEVKSYGALAMEVGQGSARAVGQAVGANPLPVLVPCHRVVTSDGRLGGFSGGLQRKVVLLRLEGVEALGEAFEAPLAERSQGSLAL